MIKKILLSLLICCSFLISNAQDKMTNEEIMAKVSKGKPFCLVILRPGRERTKAEQENQQLQMDHLGNLFRMEKEGKISIFGPIQNEKTMEGIIIFNSTDKEAIKKEMDNDPYMKSGIMKYDIYDFFTIPGQKIPG